MIWLGPGLMSLAAAQAWQLTALILAVLLATRWWTQRRPHLAYVLWLLVLLKCLTPPLWSVRPACFVGRRRRSPRRPPQLRGRSIPTRDL